MEKLRSRWESYIKKEMLKLIFIGDSKTIYFLKNYTLLNYEMLNEDEYDSIFELTFAFGNDVIKIVAQYEPRDMRYYWDIPEDIYTQNLEKILDEFD
jgi:hypothetical protein